MLCIWFCKKLTGKRCIRLLFPCFEGVLVSLVLQMSVLMILSDKVGVFIDFQVENCV